MMPKYEWRPTADDPEIFQLHHQDGRPCFLVADAANATAFTRAIQKKGLLAKQNRELRVLLELVCRQLDTRVAAEIDPDDEDPHPMIAAASDALDAARKLLNGKGPPGANPKR